MKALGRLLRLSLAPSAIADVTVGIALGSDGQWIPGAAPWLMIGSSLGVYHGAMALNDWADREQDARTRPDRPIPSGAISATQALTLGLLLVATGVGLAFAAAPELGIWMAVVAACAVGYDVRGRGALLGPSLLAACRFGNFGAGLAAPLWITGTGGALPLAPAVLYGAYVFFVSRLGRLEDDEEDAPLGNRPTRYLLAAAACLYAVPLLPTLAVVLPEAPGRALWPWLERVGLEHWLWNVAASALAVSAAAFGLVRAAVTTPAWTRGAVGACMGLALRRLLVFTAGCALLGLSWGPAPGIAAAVALAGYPLSFALRKVFPPS